MPESLNVEDGGITEISSMYYMTEKCSISINNLDDETKKIMGIIIRNTLIEPYKWIREVYKRAQEYTKFMSDTEKDVFYEQGRIYLDNYKKYGHTTWYWWRIANWGTKWNAYNYREVNNDTIKFETAWNAPIPIIEKLAEMYTNSEIEVWYADEDMGYNTGYLHCNNGVINDYICYSKCTQEAYGTYVFCKGETNCLYKDNDGFWHRRNCEECNMC